MKKLLEILFSAIWSVFLFSGFIIVYIAALMPICVVVSHFGIKGILAIIIDIAYVYIFSNFPIVNEVVLIAGAYFAYKEWPLSFFIIYVVVFGTFTLVSFIPAVKSLFEK